MNWTETTEIVSKNGDFFNRSKTTEIEIFLRTVLDYRRANIVSKMNDIDTITTRLSQWKFLIELKKKKTIQIDTIQFCLKKKKKKSRILQVHLAILRSNLQAS